MNIEQAIRHALDGRAVLFTGAGFSYGARNTDNEPIPSGKAFATELLKAIGYPSSDGQLDKAAGAYLRRKTKHDLVNLLVKRFSVSSVTKSHEVLASIPWRRVYTTNYDTVFEEAARQVKVPCTCVEGIDHPKDHLAKNNLIVHVNGVISRVSEDKLDNSFKLVSQSYAADSFENSGWAFHFRNDIRSASAVIFVGYSMYDLDIRRALFSEDISDKCIFVVAPITPDNELDAEDLADLGVVAPIGIDSFAAEVEDVRASHIPVVAELLLEQWVETNPVSVIAGAPSDNDVLSFLVEGHLRNPLLFEAFGPNKANYVIERSAFDPILAELTKQDAVTITIGELGTGKTFLHDCITQVLLSRGWRTFRLDGCSDSEIAEAESICNLPGNKLLVVEAYQRHMNLLKWLSEKKPQGVAIALSARSNVHDLFADELNILFGSRLAIFDLSSFAPNEINNAISLFDRYGLWGARMSWPVERKRRFVSDECHSYLPSLLIDVLKSKHITERYQSLLTEAPNRNEIEKLLICAFCLQVMGFPSKLNYIEELLSNRVHWAGLRAQEELKPVINFSKNSVEAKSSVLANHLLGNIFSAKKIVDTLVGMAHEAEARWSDRNFHEIFNALMRFRNVSMFLPEENRLASTINYYEEVKNLPKARSNPQFWLQYAIACLTLGQLDRSQRYFDDAYSFVWPGYNTFQIDNHYARLLCEKALREGSPKTALPLIDEARKIILKQIRSEVRYHPYRVALGLFECYERFIGSWSAAESAYFTRIFQEIKDRCVASKGSLRNNKYVVECLQKATAAIESKK